MFDIGRTIYAMEAAQAAPTIFKDSVSNSTTLLKIQAKNTLSKINFRLSGLPALKKLTQDANSSLQETLSMIRLAQDLIEGFRNDTVDGSGHQLARNPCTFLDDFSEDALDYDTELMVWRKRSTGEESPTLSPEGFHDFAGGLPTRLPNGRYSPTCSFHQFFSSVYSSEQLSCPCCRDCFVFDSAIRDTLSRMPSLDDLESLNTPVPHDMVDEDIDTLMTELEQSIRLMDDWIEGINVGLDGIKFGLRIIVRFM